MMRQFEPTTVRPLAFTQHGVVAYVGLSVLSAEFEVLRNGAYDGSGEDGDVLADART